MMYFSHIALTVLIVVILIPFLDVNPILFLLVAAFAGLLPDIDHSGSKLGRYVPFVGMIFKHRGFLHSIFPPIILYVLLAGVHETVALAVFVGYISHLIGDAITKHGIYPFAPFSKFRIRGIIETNSIGEKFAFISIIFLTGFLLLNI